MSVIKPVAVDDSDPTQLYYRLLRNTLLGKTLQRARDGLLTPTWRDSLHEDPAVRHNYSADVHALVLADILESPTAPWEPGHAPDWRTALTAWYTSARAALGESRQLNMIVLANQVGASARGVMMHAGSADQLVAAIATEDMTDDTVRSGHETYIAERDKLTASFLAGLVAGGESFDWQGWLAARAETWPNELMVNNVRLMLRSEALTPYWQKLPSYWLTS